VLGRKHGHRHPERAYGTVEQLAVGVGAARENLAVPFEHAQGERGEERATARLGWATVDPVSRKVANDGDERHSISVEAWRENHAPRPRSGRLQGCSRAKLWRDRNLRSRIPVLRKGANLHSQIPLLRKG
jgi:hypothetical protein